MLSKTGWSGWIILLPCPFSHCYSKPLSKIWLDSRSEFIHPLLDLVLRSISTGLIYRTYGTEKPNQNLLILTVLFWDLFRMCEQRAQCFAAAVPQKLPERPVNPLPQAVRLHLRNSQRTAKCIWATLKVWDNFVQLERKKKKIRRNRYSVLPM